MLWVRGWLVGCGRDGWRFNDECFCAEWASMHARFISVCVCRHRREHSGQNGYSILCDRAVDVRPPVGGWERHSRRGMDSAGARLGGKNQNRESAGMRAR
jgi:hypothetical protein